MTEAPTPAPAATDDEMSEDEVPEAGGSARGAPPEAHPRRSRLRGPLMAVGAGLLLAFSLPPWGWWPLAFGGIALFDASLAGCGPWARFGRGWLVAFGLLGPSTAWMFSFTPPGYVFEVAGFGVFLGVAMLAVPSTRWRWLALPGAWVVFEAVKGRWPFGGVPLSELAIGQVAGPVGEAARVGGVLLVGLLAVALGVALSAAIHRSWRIAGLIAVTVILVLTVCSRAPGGTDAGRIITVAYVQGGGEQGTTDAETDNREVFLAHLEASRDVPRGTDLTVWPENVVNVEGDLADAREGRELRALARRLRTTLVVGAVEGDGPDRFRNASIIYGPRGKVVGRYDKVRRVPFGEYVPLRGVLSAIAGGALPAKDAVPGTESNTIDTKAGRLGIVISWEVFFGDRGRDAINGRGEPGQILLNPTNGSSYHGTLVQSQQIGASRLRAIETGRWEVQAAPTGFSAFISPEGTVLRRSAVSEARVEVRKIPLRDGQTIYLRRGPWPPFLLGVAMIVASWLLPPVWERLRLRLPASLSRGRR